MGLVGMIFGIAFGVLYIIYKLGEEEMMLGKAGGIGCVAIVIIAGVVLCALASVGEFLDGVSPMLSFVYVVVLMFGGLAALIVWKIKSAAQISKDAKEMIEEARRQYEKSKTEKHHDNH